MGGGLALTGTASASGRLEKRFDNVVDVVDAGADNDGDEPITGVLEDHRDDDTLLYFPPGRYYIDRHLRCTDFENFGVVGDDATLVPADYYDWEGDEARMFRLGTDRNPGRDLLFEGFTVDQRAANTGVRVVEGIVEDGLVVRDVELVGQHDSGEIGPGRFAVTDSAGTGIVENFRAPDGGEWQQDTPNAGDTWRGPTGLNCTANNHGSMTFKDCVLGAFPSHGLYANSDGGQVIVKNGLYKNSNGANIRLGGEDSYVQGARVVVDRSRSRDVRQYGIRLDEGSNVGVWDTDIELSAPNGDAIRAIYPDDLRIQNVQVSMEGNVVNHGINIRGGVGKALVKYCTIDIDTAGGAAIRVSDADDSDPDPVTVDHCVVGGDAGDENNRAGIYCARDNAEFQTNSIDHSGDRYALFNSGDNVTIRNGDLKAGNHAVSNKGRNTRIDDVYAASYRDGEEAIELDDESDDVTISRSVLVNGVEDNGADGLDMWANEIV